MKLVTDEFDPVNGVAESLGVALELNKRRPVLLLLSGGSSLAALDRLPASVFGTDLTIAMLDERWSHNASINNFSQLTAMGFYERRKSEGATFFDSRPQEEESPADLAARFETFLHNWYEAHTDGVTIATLGMGTEGHTAGIFPGHVSALDAGGKWVEAYSLSTEVTPYPERVTVTPQFLTTKVDRAIVLVSGETKHPMLRTVVDKQVSPEICPAMLWHQMPHVTLLSDYQR